jgi:hypothetical protein
VGERQVCASRKRIRGSARIPIKIGFIMAIEMTCELGVRFSSAVSGSRAFHRTCHFRRGIEKIRNIIKKTCD